MTTEPEAIPADVKTEPWTRYDLAQGLAMLDGATLHEIKSTVGDPADANNWRKYLGRADDLLAHLSIACADRASRAPADGAGWQPIETAPKDGAHVLLNLGETIPHLVDARVGQFITEKEAAELGETVSASGGWIIWDTGGDWFVVPYADVFGWAPLPAAPGPLPAPASPDAEMVRPIVGIENRTAQEVFDIMSDRIRLRFSKHGGDRS